MADKGIIFSAPMVRALLDGRKTQTRRVIKDRGNPPEFCGGRGDGMNDPTVWGWEDHDRGEWITLDQWPRWRFVPFAPGDRLWVREAWAAHADYDRCKPIGIPSHEDICHAADGPVEPVWIGRNRSPIHMPRWASRLTLIVTDVRVQRLQEISPADAWVEGVGLLANSAICESPDCWSEAGRTCAAGACDAPVRTFAALWDSLHGPDAWDANPWVSAISFRCIYKNIDSLTGDE